MVDQGPPNSVILYTSFTVRHPDGEWFDRKLIGSGKLVIGTGHGDNQSTWFSFENLYVGILSMRTQ